MSAAQNKTRFLAVWPEIRDELVDYVKANHFPENALDWFKESLDYNVVGGKLNRGISVVDTAEILLGKTLEGEEYKRAAILGWGIELLQAFFLVADDIMDGSITRRGQPCWYRQPKVGNIAINDSFMLETAIYFLLKKYFRQEKYYVDIFELFQETTLQTEMGQLIDLLTAPEDHVDLDNFSLEKHHLIVVYKTAYYSFYLPVALGFHFAGVTDAAAFDRAKEVLIDMGEYFQIQDDYLDCYGTPEQIGKIGTDIKDNKCSWLINKALELVSADQRKVLDANYGVKSDETEAKVKQIYLDINLAKYYEEYEENVVGKIKKSIALIPDAKQQAVLEAFLAKVYKRQK